MKIILDKRTVAELKYGELPVIENGKIVGRTPNTKGTHYLVLDGHPDAPTGFGLRVAKTSKTYIVKLRVGTRITTSVVGRHPDLLIGNSVPHDQNARLLASELAARLRRGEKVNAARKESRTVKQTHVLGDLFDEYLEDYKANVKQRTRENTILAVQRARHRLGTELLSKSAGDVTWKDLDSFFTRKAGVEGHQTAAEQTIRWVSAVYNQANKKLTLDAVQGGREPSLYRNPARIFAQTGKIRSRAELERDYAKKGTRNPLSKTSAGFQRWLDFILSARLRASSRTAADYFLTTLFLGARRSETKTLMWLDRLKKKPGLNDEINYIDLERGEICFNDTKNDHRLVLPISNYLHRLLLERREISPDSPFVFPSVSGSPLRKVEHYNDARSFLNIVRRETGLRFTLHDLRRTLANVVNSMALPSLLVKQLLNHRSGDVTSLYSELSTEQLLEHMNNIEMRILEYATINPLKADIEVSDAG